MRAASRTGLDIDVHVDVSEFGLVEHDIEQLTRELRVFAAARLFALHRLSMGRAAELCQLSVARFIDELTKLGIPVIDFAADQLQHELTDW